MTDDLWPDSPGSIGGHGLALRFSKEQKQFIRTLDGARKFLVMRVSLTPVARETKLRRNVNYSLWGQN